MDNLQNPFRFCTILVFISFLSFGCISDLSTATVGSCRDLTYGKMLRVTGKDGAITTGMFLQMDRMPFLEYREHSKNVMAECSGCAKLPVPGERIFFSTRLVPGQIWTGTMVGFCHEYLWVRLKGETDLDHYYLYGVTRLFRSDGSVIFHNELVKLMNANQLPLMTKLLIENDEGTQHIALDQISQLEILQDGLYRPFDIYAVNSQDRDEHTVD